MVKGIISQFTEGQEPCDELNLDFPQIVTWVSQWLYMENRDLRALYPSVEVVTNGIEGFHDI